MRGLFRKRSWRFKEILHPRPAENGKEEFEPLSSPDVYKDACSVKESDHNTNSTNSQFSTTTSTRIPSNASENDMSLFRSGSYLGIPSSRLALLGPSQRMAFKDQLMKQRSASNNEETYYFKWNVWISGYQDNLGTGNKKLDIVAILVTEIDLKIFIKNELRNFLNAERSKRPAEHGRRIHIFKQGVVPIKGQLIDGYTLEIKLNHPPSVLFKQIASFIFTNRIYNDDLKISVCGISLKLLEYYYVISIWIHPFLRTMYDSDFLKTEVTNLVEAIRNGIQNEEADYCWNTIILMDNNDLSATVLEGVLRM